MTQYYLAVDIGASSGCHILGHRGEDGRIVLEEIYRFPNGLIEKDGRKVWDIDRLWEEIKTGMKKCAQLGKIPHSVGIDAWAVDYVLIDAEGKRISDAVGYCDSRADGMDEEVYPFVPEANLYAETGIQKQKFNTIYQLMAEKKQNPELLARAERMLLIPDYFHYLLTGKQVAEYTNATTTQLLNPQTKDWHLEVIDALEYPAKIFPQIVRPGTKLGDLKEEVQEEIGYTCKVVVPCTRDTASAVVAVPAPASEDILYISSGTWSFMGTELRKADCSVQAQRANFTNEGGYNYRFRFLKKLISSITDSDQDRFLEQQNVATEIRKICEEIQEFTGKIYDGIYIVGSGSNATYLNQLIAQASGKKVYAGPTEATGIGNLAVQMIVDGAFTGLSEARACIADSFDTKEYNPV